MNRSKSVLTLLIVLLASALAMAGAPAEKVRNEQVQVMQQSLAAGEAIAATPGRARVVVYQDGGSIQAADGSGKTQSQSVKRGDVVYQSADAAPPKNLGTAELRVAWVEFPGKGGTMNWGTSGLAPGYKFLFENPFCRAYDVKIAAGTSEPLHTHQTRVVICLSGADLEHVMPDGRKENSSLKTDEIAFRPAATHVGRNIGKTDLWVIAIEPK